MTRQRSSLHPAACLAAFLLLSLTGINSANANDESRPNILWVTSEDNSYHWIGCYGNEDAKTPNIDSLATDGIRYKYAYSNAAVCAVARNTLILGRYACSSGTHNMRSRYPVPSHFRTYPSFLQEAGYYCVNRSKTDYNFKTDDKSHWDECSSKAHWKNRAKDQPFFAVFNTTISHESSLFKNKTDGYRNRGVIPKEPSRDPSSVELPPHYPDTPEIRQDWVNYMDIVTAMDKQIGDWLNELDDEGVRENTIVFYYSDHGGILPRAKRYINDTGTHVPMIVRFPKKWQHLAPSPAGTVSDRPVAFIDLPPTVFSLSGVEIPEQFQGRAFAGKAAASAEPYSFLYGQRFDSRMLRFVRGVTDGEYRYVRNFHPHRHRGIYTGYPHGQVGWQSLLKLKKSGSLNELQTAYWTIPQPTEELYHTEADPWELKNLADDPQFKDRLQRMREATLDKMREIRDTGIVPESMYPSISKTGTVYDYVNDESFPYEEVLQTALTAGDGGKGVMQSLRAAMKHEHPAVRYWGATGCTIHAQGAKRLKMPLTRLLKDDSPTVQLAATEALYIIGEKETGFAKMVSLLETTEDPVVSLEALNRAWALGVMQDIPKDVWARATKQGDYSKRMAQDPQDPNLLP
ncbi:MAG: sulfatase-like hydrolase/transferase [Planctomycetota bacterium]